MTIEAQFDSDGEMVTWTADADYAAGAVIQLPDGRAGVVSVAVESGDDVGVYVSGKFRVQKTLTMVMLIGSRLFWDHSANKAHLLHGGDRDFFLGAGCEDGASAATDILVDLNVEPVYTVALEHGFQSKPVSTAGFPHVMGSGKGANLILDATNEAQKVDALSHRSVSVAGLAQCIGEALIVGVANGNNGVLDVSIGFANDTHATDADSITESIFVHLDGNDLNINLESDDGTTEVNATDSTVDYVLGTPFLVQWDFRNLSDIQIYINGVNVLPNSVFKLNAAAGPIKALAMMEKSANATPGNYSVPRLGLRLTQDI